MLAAQSGWFPVVERLLQEDQIDLDKVARSSSSSSSSFMVQPDKVNKAGRMAEQCGRKGAKQQVQQLMIKKIMFMSMIMMVR